MNKVETWKHSAQQQAAQRIEKLTDSLETLHREKSQDAAKTADRIAEALFPVAETLIMLTREAREVIETSRHQTAEAASRSSQAMEAINQAASSASQVLNALETSARKRMSRFTMGLLTASAISLPVIGWQLWQASNARSRMQQME